jgi:uncharacterized protein (UPF0335 family)
MTAHTRTVSQDSGPDLSCCEDTLEQHRSFNPLIEAILLRVVRLPDEKDPWLADLTKRLSQLAELLGAHFADEELSCLFTDIPLQCPHHAEKLERLKGEHPMLIERLKTVLDGGEALDMAVVAGRVQRTIAQVRRHEAEETEIILESFWDEGGSSE